MPTLAVALAPGAGHDVVDTRPPSPARWLLETERRAGVTGWHTRRRDRAACGGRQAAWRGSERRVDYFFLPRATVTDVSSAVPGVRACHVGPCQVRSAI